MRARPRRAFPWLAGYLPVRALLWEESRIRLAAARLGVVAVVDDRRVAPRVRVDAGGGGVADVAADRRPHDLPGSRPHVGQVVGRVDEAVHLKITAYGQRSIHDDDAVEDAIGAGGRIAVDGHGGEITGGGAVDPIDVDVVATDRVDEDDPVVQQEGGGIEGHRALV